MAFLLPPLKPIAIEERLSILFIDRGQLDVLDGAFVVLDKNGVRTHIPVGGRGLKLAVQVGVFPWKSFTAGSRAVRHAVSFCSKVRDALAGLVDGRRLYAICSNSPSNAGSTCFL